MKDEVIRSIIEAEREAVRIKQEASLKASEILKQAEANVTAEEKRTEEECKRYREEKIKAAKFASEKAYNEKIKESSDKAYDYAEDILKNIQPHVDEIMRRFLSGDR